MQNVYIYIYIYMTYNFYMNIGVYTCLFTRCVDHCNDDCTHEHKCGGEVTNKKQRKGLMHSFFLIALVSQCPFPVEMPPTTQKINEKQLLRSGKVIASTSCQNHTVAFKNCLFLKASLSRTPFSIVTCQSCHIWTGPPQARRRWDGRSGLPSLRLVNWIHQMGLSKGGYRDTLFEKTWIRRCKLTKYIKISYSGMFNKLSSHFLETVLNMQKLHTHIYIYICIGTLIQLTY